MKVMRTDLVIGASAILMGVSGLLLSFAPQETAVALGAEAPAALHGLALQLLGASQLGWAMINWMSRHSRFGGIYGRPLIVGNLLHFFAGGSAILKSSGSSTILLSAGAVYALFAIVFGWLLFRNPLADQE